MKKINSKEQLQEMVSDYFRDASIDGKIHSCLIITKFNSIAFGDQNVIGFECDGGSERDHYNYILRDLLEFGKKMGYGIEVSLN